MSIGELVNTGLSSAVGIPEVSELRGGAGGVGGWATRFNTFAGKNGNKPAPLNANVILDDEKEYRGVSSAKKSRNLLHLFPS